MNSNEKSKEKLLKEIGEEVTTLFEQALDYAQLACSTPETYKSFRSKILRIGNNCIRNIQKNVQHYDVEFVPSSEEIIEVKRPNKIMTKVSG